MNQRYLKAAASLFFLLIFSFAHADEGVVVTKITGGEAVLLSTVSGNFTTLTDLIVEETTPTQIGPDDSDLILELPSGFEFDTTSKISATISSFKLDGTSGCTGGTGNHSLKIGTTSSGSSSANVTPTSTSLTLHIKQSSAGNCRGVLRFSGFKVRPSLHTVSSGIISYRGSTFITGLIQNESDLGTLTSVDDTPQDETPPVITLVGESSITLFQGDIFIEPGFSAMDQRDGEVEVVVDGIVDTERIGNYTRTYSATDSSGNKALVTREVHIIEHVPQTSPHIVPEEEIELPVTPPQETFKEEKSTKSSGSFARTNEVQTIEPSSTSISAQPEVLGASTMSCEASQIHETADENNITEEIKKLQRFLNSNLVLAIPLSGEFDALTDEALSLFESKYQTEIFGDNVLELINTMICAD
jgi:hypothetical protein